MKVVYLLLNKDTGYIKIGITQNIDKRKRTLELHSGSKLKLLYVTNKLNRYRVIESSFKTKYKQYKLEGEWFCFDKEEAIETLQYIIQNLERNPLPL